jgi:hypothetical protein
MDDGTPHDIGGNFWHRHWPNVATPFGWILPRPSAVQLFVGISVNLPKCSAKMAIADSLKGIVDGMQKWMFIQ